MGVAEKLAALAATLPPSRQAEVLDFIELLRSRAAASGGEVAGWSERAFEQLGVAGLADDDDPVVYDLGDGKETR
jgi:hypothetical protein